MSFQYKANDGQADSNTSTVTITINGVNDPPKTANDTATTNEDTSVNGTVVDNTTDPDDNPAAFNYSIVGPTPTGLTFNADGTWAFDPAGNFDGLDTGESATVSFQYKANDGEADSNTSTVTITIHGGNNSPTTTDDTATTSEDTLVGGSVVDNTTDPDDAPASLAYSVVGTVPAGLVFNADGTWSFDPAGNFDGLDTGESTTVSFQYKANDGEADSNTSTVTITINGVNDPPVTTDDSATTNEDTSVNGTVVDNTTDPDDNPAAFNYSIVGPTPTGLTFNADGTWAFDPAGNFDGLDTGESATVSFQYKANDGQADSNTSTVTITINGVNDPPKTANDTATTNEDTSVNGTVVDNTTDPDDNPTGFTYGVVGATPTGLVFNSNGTWTFNPAGNFEHLDTGESATVTFQYKANDGEADSNTSTVTITINGVNDPPKTTNDSATTNEDTPINGTVVDNTTDPDDNPAAFTYSVVGGSPGGLTFNPNGTYTFNPAGSFDHLKAGESTTVSFQYKANDGEADSNTSTVTITINGVNDPPKAEPVEKPVVPVDAKTNLLLIIDISGSMNDSSGLPGLSRLAVAKAALNELIEQYDGRGDVMIRIVTFSSTGQAVGTAWLSVADAKAQIAALTAGGATDYDAALASATSAFATTTGKLTDAGVQNVAYFVSDGAPTEGDNTVGIVNSAGDPEITNWENFLAANDITSYALGMGTGVNTGNLAPIAYDGVTETQIAPVVVTDLEQLSGALVATISQPVSGNLLTDSVPVGSFGPDDGGYVKSITIDGTTYTYDPAANGGAGGLTFAGGPNNGTFDTVTNSLTVLAASGGKLTIDMDDGNFTYLPPGNLPANFSENIGYVLSDFFGATDASTLAFNGSTLDYNPIVRDDTAITNVTGGNGTAIAIPTWALTYSDTDLNGEAVSVTAVGSANNGSVALASGNATFTDNNTNGGSFSYTGSSGAPPKTDTGIVTVNRAQSGESTLDGTGLGDILIGRAVADTLNGNQGNDVLIAAGGNDTLNGGTGADLMVGGSGADTMAGGAGRDIFKYLSSDEIATYDDIITDFAVDNAATPANEGDIVDISLLIGTTLTAGNAASYVRIVNSGGNAAIQVDANGATGGANFETVAVLNNVAYNPSLAIEVASDGNFTVKL